MVESADGRYRKSTPAESAAKSPKPKHQEDIGPSEPLFRRSGGKIPVIDNPHGITLPDNGRLDELRRKLAEYQAELKKGGGEVIVDFDELEKED